ncbi:MAG TPA: hypothetical protein PL029_03155 [Bacteroidia bacterium]|nr:hypothetical protein [Bacteroidia bacterium]
MGKEKEMLRAILSNTELIMAHLKIKAGVKEKQVQKPVGKNNADKPLAAKKPVKK